MAIVGDTIRLKAEFKSWDGVLADPDNIVLKLYDAHKVQIGEDIPIGTQHNVSPGVYQYEYTVTDIPLMYFEFQGQLEGKPILARSTINIIWCERG